MGAGEGTALLADVRAEFDEDNDDDDDMTEMTIMTTTIIMTTSLPSCPAAISGCAPVRERRFWSM
jgi:hypothetical protein